MLNRALTGLWFSPVWTTSGSIAVKVLGLGILLPIALSRLPVAEASLWFLFSSLMAFQGLINFGFSPTFVRFIAYSQKNVLLAAAQPVGQPTFGNTNDKGVAVIHSMRYVTSRLALASAVFALTFGSLAVSRPIAQIDSPLFGWIAWIFVALVGAVSMHGSMYVSCLQGIEKIADFRRWEILTSLLGSLLCCVVLLAGGGLFALVIMAQVTIIGQIVINRLLVFKFTGAQYWQEPARLDTNIMRSMWPAAWRSGLGVLMSQGTILATGIIYAQLAPPQAVASYLLAVRLVQAIVDFANVPFYVRIPMMSRLYGSKMKQQLIAIGRGGMLSASWIYVAGVVLVLFYGQKLLDLIGSDTVLVSSQLWMMLCLAIFFHRVGAMHLQLYSTSNHIVWHIANGISGLIMLCIMPFAYLAFGVIGFPLSLLIGYLFFYTPYCMTLSYRTFEMEFLKMDMVTSVFPLIILGSLMVGSFLNFF